MHGLTRAWSRHELVAVLLATDGAATALTYGLAEDWCAAWTAIEQEGAAEFLRRVEDAERSDPDGQRWPRSKPHDDKLLAVVRFA